VEFNESNTPSGPSPHSLIFYNCCHFGATYWTA